MGTKIYCNKCKKNFITFHDDLELIAVRPDFEADDFGCEFQDRLYSCPRCDAVFIDTEYMN